MIKIKYKKRGELVMRRKTPKEFEQEFYNAVGDEHTLLSEYKTSRKPITIKHNTCGNIYEASANRFQQGGRCPNCNGNKAKQKTTQQFRDEVYELVGTEYTIIGKYVNRSTNIKIKHNRCGRIYQVEPGNFLYGSRCIECYYQDMRHTDEDVENIILEYLGGNYKWVSKEYTSMQHTIEIKHSVCGNTYETRLTDMVQKRTKCPYCNRSIGEQMVDEYLKAVGVEFEIQKRFEGLRNINKLSYDFFIPSRNIAIEYQGEQHYRPKNFGGVSSKEAQDNYAMQKERDAIKRKYAEENNIELIEVPYTVKTTTKVKNFLEEAMN